MTVSILNYPLGSIFVARSSSKFKFVSPRSDMNSSFNLVNELLITVINWPEGVVICDLCGKAWVKSREGGLGLLCISGPLNGDLFSGMHGVLITINNVLG